MSFHFVCVSFLLFLEFCDFSPTRRRNVLSSSLLLLSSSSSSFSLSSSSPTDGETKENDISETWWAVQIQELGSKGDEEMEFLPNSENFIAIPKPNPTPNLPPNQDQNPNSNPNTNSKSNQISNSYPKSKARSNTKKSSKRSKEKSLDSSHSLDFWKSFKVSNFETASKSMNESESVNVSKSSHASNSKNFLNLSNDSKPLNLSHTPNSFNTSFALNSLKPSEFSNRPTPSRETNEIRPVPPTDRSKRSSIRTRKIQEFQAIKGSSLSPGTGADLSVPRSPENSPGSPPRDFWSGVDVNGWTENDKGAKGTEANEDNNNKNDDKIDDTLSGKHLLWHPDSAGCRDKSHYAAPRDDSSKGAWAEGEAAERLAWELSRFEVEGQEEEEESVHHVMKRNADQAGDNLSPTWEDGSGEEPTDATPPTTDNMTDVPTAKVPRGLPETTASPNATQAEMTQAGVTTGPSPTTQAGVTSAAAETTLADNTMSYCNDDEDCNIESNERCTNFQRRRSVTLVRRRTGLQPICKCMPNFIRSKLETTELSNECEAIVEVVSVTLVCPVEFNTIYADKTSSKHLEFLFYIQNVYCDYISIIIKRTCFCEIETIKSGSTEIELLISVAAGNKTKNNATESTTPLPLLTNTTQLLREAAKRAFNDLIEEVNLATIDPNVTSTPGLDPGVYLGPFRAAVTRLSVNEDFYVRENPVPSTNPCLDPDRNYCDKDNNGAEAECIPGPDNKTLTCRCRVGFHDVSYVPRSAPGEHCSPVCYEGYCLNGGRCYNDKTEPLCDCNAWYNGVRCDVDLWALLISGIVFLSFFLVLIIVGLTRCARNRLERKGSYSVAEEDRRLFHRDAAVSRSLDPFDLTFDPGEYEFLYAPVDARTGEIVALDPNLPPEENLYRLVPEIDVGDPPWPALRRLADPGGGRWEDDVTQSIFLPIPRPTLRRRSDVPTPPGSMTRSSSGASLVISRRSSTAPDVDLACVGLYPNLFADDETLQIPRPSVITKP